jgi:hypothetical protein
MTWNSRVGDYQRFRGTTASVFMLIHNHHKFNVKCSKGCNLAILKPNGIMSQLDSVISKYGILILRLLARKLTVTSKYGVKILRWLPRQLTITSAHGIKILRWLKWKLTVTSKRGTKILRWQNRKLTVTSKHGTTMLRWLARKFTVTTYLLLLNLLNAHTTYTVVQPFITQTCFGTTVQSSGSSCTKF